MQIKINNRFSGSLIFECDAENIKVAVELEVSKKINLRGANLSGANLGGAYLGGANLGSAYLGGAYLGCVCLSGAYLGGAYLGGANLSGANLSGAYLGGAYLGCVCLSGANLGGAKISDGITITKAPIQIIGLTWTVTIWDLHMQIGCEFHSHEDWANFSDDDWLRMGGKEALLLKRQQYPVLAILCLQHQPSETVAA